MDFEHDEDQRELQRTIRALLTDHATPDVVRDAAEHQAGFAAEVWRRLAGEMELHSLYLAAEHGGTGASFVELAIALEEVGRTLVPVPLLATTLAAATIALAEDPDGLAPPLLSAIAGGERAAVALGESALTCGGQPGGARISGVVEHVVDCEGAARLVVSARDKADPVLVAVDLDAEGVSMEPLATLDQTRRQARIELHGAPAALLSRGERADAVLARARDLHATALAAESIGAATACLEHVVAYLHERVQFGRPIGSFQGLKHRCADLLVALERARSTAGYAAWAVDGAPEELAVLAPMAQLLAGEAFMEIAAEAIQLQGGIAFTWEHEAHLYLKRAKSSQLLFGQPSRLRACVAERAGLVTA